MLAKICDWCHLIINSNNVNHWIQAGLMKVGLMLGHRQKWLAQFKQAYCIL